MAKDFKQGVLVWVKMKGFPPWPAKLAFPTDGKPPKSKETQHFVYFFGIHDHTWIFDKFIFPHSADMLAQAKSYRKISSTMLAAIQEIEHACRKSKKKIKLLTDVKESVSLSPSIVKQKLLKRSVFAMLKNTDRGVDYSLLNTNVPSDNGNPNVAVIRPYSGDSKPHSTIMNFNETFSNLSSTSSCTSGSSIKNNIILPTSKKIGVLGFGDIVCEFVKTLLDTGHKVIIWNKRILDTSATFVEMGAKTARHPADVLQDSDITFSWAYDAEAAKKVVFGDHGVLAGFNELCINKGYVEMTSIDPVTSQEIGAAIVGSGGRYLEARMFDPREDLKDSTVSIFAAGNRSLFYDSNTVFAIFTKNALLLNCDVGGANNIKLWV